MIRSTKHTIKFANNVKKEQVINLIKRYRIMTEKYVNILWNNGKNNPPSMLDNKICRLIKTNVEYDSRIRQCAGKQACSMVKAVIGKQNKRLFKLKKLQKEKKDTKYLQRTIDITNVSKPKCHRINIELDSRFVNFQEGSHFDLFVEIEQIGNKEKIRIPIKHSEVSRKWMKEGKLLTSIRVSEKYITLYWEIEQKLVTGTKTLGADQGKTTCLTLSDGQCTCKDCHGHDLNTILDKMARKKKGSKGFKRVQAQRKNYIHWSLNQLNFDNVKELKFEKIRNLRRGKRASRKMSHWVYTLIKNKMVSLSEDKGFVFTEQDNRFRSQRCSQCGWTHKSNRKGKTFKCLNANCGFCTDSDLNAASNHEVELIEVTRSVWQKRPNRTTGFFWLADRIIIGQELIVPDVHKNLS